MGLAKRRLVVALGSPDPLRLRRRESHDQRDAKSSNKRAAHSSVTSALGAAERVGGERVWLGELTLDVSPYAGACQRWR